MVTAAGLILGTMMRAATGCGLAGLLYGVGPTIRYARRGRRRRPGGAGRFGGFCSPGRPDRPDDRPVGRVISRKPVPV